MNIGWKLAFHNLLLIGILFPAMLCGQPHKDLTLSGSYFKLKLGEARNWVSNNETLRALLAIDTLAVTRDSVILMIKGPDLLTQQSGELPEDSVKRLDVYRATFDRLLFINELLPDQLKVEAETPTKLMLFYMKDGVFLHSEMQKMAIDSVASPSVPTASFTLPVENDKIRTSKTIQQVKRLLTGRLRDHFRQYKTNFQPFNFNIVYNVGNEMVIEVKNITNLILEQNYFEFLRLQFVLGQQASDVEVTFGINAKYASGIIWSPRSSEYKDISATAPEKMTDYYLQFKSLLNTILN